MDSYLATASVDPDVSPASLALIAGTIDLAMSSAREWDAVAGPHPGSLFMWGWLNWVAGVVFSDVSGCITGVAADFAITEALGLDESSGSLEWGCFDGAIFGSIFAVL
jgi:hypothetical protein